MTITSEMVKSAIMHWPSTYETKDGQRFKGCPVSAIPSQMRDAGYRNIPKLDAYDLRQIGIEVVCARYIGGARPKKFCDVAIGERSKGDGH